MSRGTASSHWVLRALPVFAVLSLSLFLPAEAAGQPLREADQDTVAKRMTLPPLTLPDIVIFGRGSATVREGSKLFTTDKRTALEREIGAPIGEKLDTRTGWGGGRMLAAQERAGPGRRARAYLRGATYSEFLGGGEYWVDMDRWRLLALAGGEGTKGHRLNSSSMGGFGRLSAIRQLGTSTEIRFKGGFSGGRQEEWGEGVPLEGVPAAPANAVREWYEGDYAVELEGAIRRGLSLRGSAGGRHSGLNDDVRVVGLQPRSNGGWASAELEWVTNRMILSLAGRTEGDRLKGVLPVQDARLTSATFSVQALFGGSSSALLGVSMYDLNVDPFSVRRFWPKVQFTSRYSERFSMYIDFLPRIDYMALGEARDQNLFVGNSYSVIPREEKFHLAIGLKYLVAPRITAGFQVARRLFDRLPVWQLAPATDSESRGLFILNGLVSVGVNETRLSLEGEPKENLAFNSELLLRDPTGGIEQLPQIPRLEFSAGVQARGPWNLDLGAKFTYLGERFGEEIGIQARSLAPTADLSLHTARSFGGFLTVWLELRNVLDQEVVLWESYPMPGFTTALGLSFRF